MRMWQTIRTSSLGRHSHDEAFAAIVLAGGYEEAGDLGRFQVKVGDVVLHDRFEAHLDRFSASGAVMLNLRLGHLDGFTPGLATIADPDAIVRAAEKDQVEAVGLLLAAATGRRTLPADWPDELATALIGNPSLVLSDWAHRRGIAPWTVSRGFARVFGVTPEGFRARVRTRRAWRSIRTSQTPLAWIAAEQGFADQPHMTRSVKQLTGMVPQMWRRCK